jgi:hypothetical protein
MEWAACELACRLGHVDAAVLLRRAPFRAAVTEATTFLSVEHVVAAVIAEGPLATAHSPYGALINRLRAVAADGEERARLRDEGAEAERWRRVDAAASRGETLRALVDAGRVHCDEAEATVRAEFADEDLRGIALTALTGGQR